MLLGMAKPIPSDPAGLRQNRRVDSHDLSLEIEQRSAAVARVYGRVGLQEILVVVRVGDAGAVGRADNSLGDGLIESFGSADRDHPLADFDVIGICEGHMGKGFRMLKF